MKNTSSLQGSLSIAILVCLVIGWFDLFSPQINYYVYQILFYILVGFSSILMSLNYQNSTLKYIGIAFGLICIIGALLPTNLGLSGIKSIGLIGGVILSFFNRR